MRIALFGGSFDPPHVAHQMACLYALSTQDIDQVWMVPCFRHPFDKRSAPFAHRVAMCRLAAAPLGQAVQVNTIEEELDGPSYTLVTVKALMARHPEHAFSLLIGADLLQERQRWHGYPELSRLVPFLVIGRAGAPEDAGDGTEVRLPAVSSTWVRSLLMRGVMPRGLLPGTVLEYIRQHALYQAAEGAST